MKRNTIPRTTSAAAATTSAAVRQPRVSTTPASSGRKTSCPVALAAESAPRTTPRFSSNHRVATIAASTIDVTPVPVPTSTPHSSISCHSACMRAEAAIEAASSSRAPSTTRRSPQRSITAAANGPIKPNRAMLTATAAEITARLHPNSLSSGTMNSPGVARTPAVMSSTTKVTAAITHA